MLHIFFDDRALRERSDGTVFEEATTGTSKKSGSLSAGRRVSLSVKWHRKRSTSTGLLDAKDERVTSATTSTSEKGAIEKLSNAERRSNSLTGRDAIRIGASEDCAKTCRSAPLPVRDGPSASRQGRRRSVARLWASIVAASQSPSPSAGRFWRLIPFDCRQRGCWLCRLLRKAVFPEPTVPTRAMRDPEANSSTDTCARGDVDRLRRRASARAMRGRAHGRGARAHRSQLPAQ